MSDKVEIVENIGSDVGIICLVCENREFRILQGRMIRLYCTRCNNLIKVSGAQLAAPDENNEEVYFLPIRRDPETFTGPKKNLIHLNLRLEPDQLEVVNRAVQTLYENETQNFFFYDKRGTRARHYHTREKAIELACAEVLATYGPPKTDIKGRAKPILSWRNKNKK